MKRILIALSLASALGESAQAKDLTAYGHAPDLNQMKAAATKAIMADMKDPDSAEFDWSGTDVKLGKRGWFICGRVNGKNSYGGYEGYSQFLARKAASAGDMSVTVKMAPGNLTWNECFAASLASPNPANW